jgi:hypothetical protein
MASRPCKPDADLKGLWRTLLGVPFPACGMPEESDAATGEGVDPSDSSRQSAEPIGGTRTSET